MFNTTTRTTIDCADCPNGFDAAETFLILQHMALGRVMCPDCRTRIKATEAVSN